MNNVMTEQNTLASVQDQLAPKANVIRLNAGNDINGNPRRVFVALVGPYFIGAWDEGYEGYLAVPKSFVNQAKSCLTFDVTADEYEKQLAWADELKTGYLSNIVETVDEK
jgi:hypothetical protein